MARVTPRLEPRDHGVDRRGPSPASTRAAASRKRAWIGPGFPADPGRRARRRGARPGGRRRAGGHRPSWSPPPPLPPSRPPAEHPRRRSPRRPRARRRCRIGPPSSSDTSEDQRRRGGSSSAQIADSSRFDFPVLGSPTIAAIASGRKRVPERAEPRTWTVVSPARVIARPRLWGDLAPPEPARRAPGLRRLERRSAVRTRRPGPPSPVGRAASGAAGSPSITRTTAPAISSSSQPP